MPLTNKTVRRRDQKQDWINAFKKAIQQEQEKAQLASDWEDYTEQYVKSLADVGIRVPIEVIRYTRITIDENTINKPEDLDELWQCSPSKRLTGLQICND
jgi:hypothetical protein